MISWGSSQLDESIERDPYCSENQEYISSSFVIGFGEFCVFRIGPNEVTDKNRGKQRGEYDPSGSKHECKSATKTLILEEGSTSQERFLLSNA